MPFGRDLYAVALTDKERLMIGRSANVFAWAWAALLAYAFVSLASAQQPPSTPAPTLGAGFVAEPAYDFEFYFLDVQSGELKKLEKAQANTNVKSGFMSAAGYWEIDGAASTVRFPRDTQLNFVIRGLPRNMNPEDQLTLRRYESTRSTRRFKVNKTNIGGAKMLTSEGKIALVFEPYGATSLKIAPERQPLDAGEYVLASGKNPMTKFCFGIDGPEN